LAPYAIAGLRLKSLATYYSHRGSSHSSICPLALWERAGVRACLLIAAPQIARISFILALSLKESSEEMLQNHAWPQFNRALILTFSRWEKGQDKAQP
jgi:hypothetical protein